MPRLELWFASGEASLSAIRFTVHEALSTLYSVTVVAHSDSPAVDLEAIVGKPAGLRADTGYRFSTNSAHAWGGICRFIQQVQAEPRGASTYELCIVPSLWLLTQRTNHRIFQRLSAVDIATQLLTEWGVDHAWSVDRARHPKLEIKIQYGESDFAFLARLLAEAGITFSFASDERGVSRVILADEPQSRQPRASAMVYVDHPNRAAEQEFITDVRLRHEVRPGASLLRDHDFRSPTFALFGGASAEAPGEERYEQYHYQPGGFLVETGRGGATPMADDKGVYRHDMRAGQARAERMLQADRAGRRAVSFNTNVFDIEPGTVVKVDDHPHPELSGRPELLITTFTAICERDGEWTMSATAVFADAPYRPPTLAKVRIFGVQAALVVGPVGEEIHTDEFGRVRVQFPWDRDGKVDDNSSCWMRVSQGWAGTGFGLFTLPRVGQEVLVAFLDGDPDQPMIVGRVFNNTSRVPYTLPENKTRSTWKSRSSPAQDGFNEILFEDLAGRELVYEQAQKNRRRLVKRDETITVGNDREKLVKANETETTLANRVEVTGVNRTELTSGNRTYVIGQDRSTLVKGSDVERVAGDLTHTVGGNADIVVSAARRERVGGAASLTVEGDQSARVGGTQSWTIGGGRQEKISGAYGLDVGGEVHIKTAGAMVLEVGQDFTIKGPGGFLRINSEGVTIYGTLVKVNSGGSPGSGAGASPAAPEAPRSATPSEPAAPEPDDVGRTGLGQ